MGSWVELVWFCTALRPPCIYKTRRHGIVHIRVTSNLKFSQGSPQTFYLFGANTSNGLGVCEVSNPQPVHCSPASGLRGTTQFHSGSKLLRPRCYRLLANPKSNSATIPHISLREVSERASIKSRLINLHRPNSLISSKTIGVFENNWQSNLRNTY